MAIKEIAKSEVHFIETDEEDYYSYTRYSATNWTVVMGESDEPVSDCEELEAEFQRAIARRSNENSELYLQNVSGSLPTDLEIETEFQVDNKWAIEDRTHAIGKRQGAKWMRDKVSRL